MNDIVQVPDDIQVRIETALAVTIKTPADAEAVTDGLTLVRRMIKRIAESRLELTKPLNDTIKKLIDIEKERKAPLQKADTELDGKIKAWQLQLMEAARLENERIARENAELERIALEEQNAKIAAAEEEARQIAILSGATEAEAEAEAAAAKVEAEAPTLFNPPAVEAKIPVAVPKQTIGNYGSAGITMRKTYVIVDEALIPREYLKVDEVKIGQAVRGGIAAIPGIEIKEEASVTVRR